MEAGLEKTYPQTIKKMLIEHVLRNKNIIPNTAKFDYDIWSLAWDLMFNQFGEENNQIEAISSRFNMYINGIDLMNIQNIKPNI